jgi:unsaturated rhamnogalacturonyl hydrolase
MIGELCTLLLLIVIVIISIDIIPIFKDWLSRIHIGRNMDKFNWSNKITNRGSKWLNNTPKIKVTDNTRLTIIDILTGNYSKDSIQHWQEASILLGLAEFLKYNHNEEIEQEIIKFLDSKIDNRGQWIIKPEYIDGAILAFAIMKLDFIDNKKYKNALDYILEMIRIHIGTDGTVMYRKNMEGYRYVDSIGFICPFLVSYGVKYQNAECIDLAIKQIKDYEKFGMLYNHNIPCHAYKVENKAPLGLYGWGRGLGWYAIGLIDSWAELPEKNKYKSVLEESVKKFALSALAFQKDNGSWNWTVTRAESRPDSSTTATLAWFMLNASKVNEIECDCLNSTEKAINYLMSVTRRNGAIDFSQGDTKDIGVYSMLFNILPFTQGFSIRVINLFNNIKVVKQTDEFKNYKLS